MGRITSRLARSAPLLAALLLAGCASLSGPPIPLAQHVDMDRMYGGWHIAATIPNSFEKGMVEPYELYSARTSPPAGAVSAHRKSISCCMTG
jgi:lipocalin